MAAATSSVPQSDDGIGDAGRRPIAVDLFAGVGGFALGFEQAGFDVVAALEYDSIHAAAHVFNFPRAEVLCRNASNIGGEELSEAVARGVDAHDRAEQWDGEVDVVFGGVPCQGFSTAGKRDRDDPRNLLVHDFRRLVLALQPRYFVMENVPGMKSSVESRRPETKMLDALVSEFEAESYTVLEPKVLNASRYGVPQDRRRLIVVGARSDQPPASYPEPTVRPRTKRASARQGLTEGQLATNLPLGPSVWDAIGDLPDVDGFDELWSSDEVALSSEVTAQIASSASAYARVLGGLDEDRLDLSHPRAWDAALLTSSMRTAHTLRSIQRFARTRQGESESVSRYYRLDAQGLCSTLRAGTGYERGSFMAPRPIHPTAHRVISVREAARLHSFPDWFRFHATKWHGFRQIGNALPPLLGRAIGASIAAALGVAPAKPMREISLGHPTLLRLGTNDAAARLGADLADAPSHKLRSRRPRKMSRGVDRAA